MVGVSIMQEDHKGEDWAGGEERGIPIYHGFGN